MLKKEDVPDTLKPYIFHGVDFNYRKSDKEALAECPFCGAENKFSVDIKTSKWRCLVCGESGNQYTFLVKLWREGIIDAVLIEHLAKERGLECQTVIAWGVVVSSITRDYLVPGYNVEGKISQLYKYVKLRNGEKKLLATPTIHHQIHGVNLYDRDKKVVYLCEGPWDAMKLWETLGSTVERNGKFFLVKGNLDSKRHMLVGANVLAVPGCSTFRDSWCEVFLDKKVYIVYDNDYPRRHPKTGKMITPAAYAGVQRTAGILGKGPSEIKYLQWGKDGFDVKLPNGMDVRDFLNGSGNSIGDLIGKLKKVPSRWLVGSSKTSTPKRKQIRPIECKQWLRLSNQWRKALSWGDGLDVTLSVMLASVITTDVSGDQLWIKVMGPASCGKTTLCEAISVSKNYILAKSTIRGFHSGFKSDSGGEEDNSLINQLRGKSLVTKDGDTLLQSPNLGQILSEARDIYDGTSRTHYRNQIGREYEDIRMTWILCGTSSLRQIDESELGERFLDCVIMDGVDDKEEDEVLMRVVERENRNVGGDERFSGDQDMLLAKQLTGGYVEFLRDNSQELLSRVVVSKSSLILIARIGKFVSYMRARPSKKQIESAEREFGARLVSQHLRLAKSLAAVLNRDTIDAETMCRTVKVALDTSRGVTFDICRHMYMEVKRTEGIQPRALSLAVNQQEYKIVEMLRFLRKIDVVEHFEKKSRGLQGKTRWRLTTKISKLYSDVVYWDK